MKIDHKIHNDIVILSPSGEMRSGRNENLLHQEVSRRIKEGNKKFLFDMADVPYMDSAGLGVVLRCYTSIRKSGGVMKLTHLSERVLEIFQITRMSNLMDWYTDEEKALKAFASKAR